MQTPALHLDAPSLAEPARRDRSGEFTRQFARLQASNAPTSADHALQRQVREAAQQLVSSSLIQPLLAEAQKDPFRTDLFHGGQGEEVFQQQFNQAIADRITSRSNLSVVDAIYRKIMMRVGGETASRVTVHG